MIMPTDFCAARSKGASAAGVRFGCNLSLLPEEQFPPRDAAPPEAKGHSKGSTSILGTE